MVDYVCVAIAYAEEAIEDTKGRRFGKWIRLAAKRFITDLKRAQRRRAPFVFSAERANHVCTWIELLPHVEGDWAKPTIVLHPAQVFFLVQLFGFRSHQGGRRFTTALFAVARKNAKSTLAAAILLYCLCEEPEQGPQILSAATTGAQARKVFDPAKRMVERTADLRENYLVEAFAHAIARYENGGSFKPINAKASTQDGWNPSVVCLDELHAHKTHDLLNVLRSASGARSNPLFLYTTTEGYETPGPWPEERHFAQQLLAGILKADHYLALIFAVDDEDEDFDESRWVKANPLLDVTPVLAKAIRKDAIEAKGKPGSLAEFQIKRLNRRAASAKGAIDIRLWRRCNGQVPLEALRGAICWGGLDLASTRDMNAWRLLWLKAGVFYTWGRYWVPSAAVAQRTERGTVPYATWVADGKLTLTEGEVADHAQIECEIRADCELYRPRSIAYDRYEAAQIVQHLKDAGYELEEFIQGPKSYQPAWQAFERTYVAANLRHGADPILTWNAANLVPRYDANMNMAPDRKRSHEKIDGIVALLMAFGLAAHGDPASVYESRGLLVA